MTNLALVLESLPALRRRDAWRDGTARFGIEVTLDESTVPSGRISAVTASTGAQLADIAGDAQRFVMGGQSKSAPMLVMLVLFGRGRIHAGPRAIELAPGDLALFDMAARSELQWRDGFRTILLELPRAPLVSRLGRARISFPMVLGATVAASAARPVLKTLATDVDALDDADFTAGQVALTELLASAMLGEDQTPGETTTGVQAAHLRRVEAIINAGLANAELAPADVARQAGMSVRYLQRLFEIRGESFSEYVRLRRLERCRADLLDPHHARESIAAIGLRWGFRDQAHFSRAFSAVFGASPTELRRSALQADPGPELRGRPANGGVHRPGRRPSVTAGTVQRPPVVQPLGRHHLPATADTVHWGFLSRALPPVLRIEPGATVTVETLTQHGGDDWERLVAGDPGAESVFEWTADRKGVDRRGAGPMNASVFGRGAGEGFGVHICTGPIHVRGAEPGDVLEVEILDIRPRPSGNPLYAGKAFASNASAWWGYQYADLLEQPQRHETVTIFEIDVGKPDAARALYSYRWMPQTDPFGVVHSTMDYPGVPVDHTRVEHRNDVLAGIAIPARMHFGFMAVAPRESELVDSIPPGYFGGNIDNWRLGKGARIYLPVAVEGALFSVGDGHFAQGDGEINGTGLECSLTGDLRFKLHKPGAASPAAIAGLRGPLIETPSHWVVQSFSYPNYLRDLGRDAQAEVYKRSTVDLALRSAFRQTRRFLMDVYGLSEDEALTLMSLAVDFAVTQVADGNFGVHATIAKAVFENRAPRPI